MFNLIRNEFHVHKVHLIVNLMLIFFLYFVARDNFPLLFIGLILTLLFTRNMYFYDIRNNSEVLMNSLPVSRKQIVTSKYVTVTLFALICFSFSMVLNMFFNMYGKLTLFEFVTTLTILAIFMAFFFPSYYLFGPVFIRYAMVLLVVLIFAVGPMVLNLGVKNNFWGLLHLFEQYSIQFAMSMLAVIAVLISLSWLLSYRIYEAKEL
ncbi:ABC-2 transporter permease [Cytobacillus sp. IB215665]|uniref:ABC-2 transporter permease n=1 Tax=Cytobacillus sp. IB215665 TaxID=3097357 RepID=UPI002A11B1AF|nr:ABC-2 transporter permease [Cytobacillus sp. IB215665]MDX8365988.1 ABC-2 transporter permease [Cytobacillus sp. IB215665]